MQPFDYQPSGKSRPPHEDWSDSAHFLQLLLDITTIAGTVKGPDEFIQTGLARICDSFVRSLGVAWLIDPRTQQLHCVHVEDATGKQTEPFIKQCRSTTFIAGQGIPGDALKVGALVIPNLSREEGFSRLYTAAKAGLKSAYAFSIKSDGHVLGVFELFLGEPLPANDGRTHLLDNLGSLVGLLYGSKLSAIGHKEELQSHEQRLNTIIENMAEAVFLFDKQGKVILSNGAADALTGNAVQNFPIDWAQVSSLYLPDGVTPFPIDKIPVLAALRGEELYDVEVCLRNYLHQTGLWLSVNARPLRDADGDITGAVIVARDVTPRRALQEQLQAVADEAIASSKLKSEFVANVSHEIRTPLAGVLGMAELLTARDDLDVEAQEVAQYILHSAHNLLNIVNDLLDFSKLEAGKLTLSKQWFSVADLLDEVSRSIAVPASKKGLEVNVQCDHRIPKAVYGDRGRILQVLLNFAHNATKFTESGQILLSATEDSVTADVAKIKFAVHDTGIGISQSNLERLFQPFVQGDGSSTRAFGGTGLGLSISKKLTELMSGQVGAESAAGRGSTFWAVVPVEVERE